ncbi:MAG: Holliday junction resolvase RuvX [Gammaproteobacteria bacterium]|nr:Holliday junction resolvase RuvX [Gammaproteobacteria bacterium]
MAFDYGERRIGVAFANRATQTATALKTIPARDDSYAQREIASLVSEWRPDAIVIGLPYTMDGGASPMAARAMAFAERLSDAHGLPIETIDERLTSAEAGMLLREQRQTGQRRRRIKKEDIDSLSAQLIAETWLRCS